LLDAIAATQRGNPQVDRVGVRSRGHADDRERPSVGRRARGRRALTALVDRWVQARLRLVVRAYGGNKPLLVRGRNEDCRVRGTRPRVEFNHPESAP
jgi:hypothetical protein